MYEDVSLKFTQKSYCNTEWSLHLWCGWCGFSWYWWERSTEMGTPLQEPEQFRRSSCFRMVGVRSPKSNFADIRWREVVYLYKSVLEEKSRSENEEDMLCIGAASFMWLPSVLLTFIDHTRLQGKIRRECLKMIWCVVPWCGVRILRPFEFRNGMAISRWNQCNLKNRLSNRKHTSTVYFGMHFCMETYYHHSTIMQCHQGYFHKTLGSIPSLTPG